MVVLSISGDSDKRLGFLILFGVFTMSGVIAMFVDPGGLFAAWGFATAILAGIVFVILFHV